jgi:hypothetical protein
MLFVPPAGCVNIQIFIFSPNVVSSYVNVDDVSMHLWNPPTKFYDNFQRADGTPDKSPGGFPYDLKSNELSISDKRLVFPARPVTGWAYAHVDLPAIPKIMKTYFRWADDGTEIGDSVVMASSNDRMLLQNNRHMLHFYITTTNWVFQTWNDAGEITSLGSGALTLLPEVDYQFAMVISGNTVILKIPTIEDQIITHESIGTMAGQYVFYEIGRTTVDYKTPSLSYIEAVY